MLPPTEALLVVVPPKLIFRWLDLQRNDALIRVYDVAGNVIEAPK